MSDQLKTALQNLVNFVPAHNEAIDFVDGDDQAAAGPAPLLSKPFLGIVLGDEDAGALRDRLAAVCEAAGTSLAELEGDYETNKVTPMSLPVTFEWEIGHSLLIKQNGKEIKLNNNQVEIFLDFLGVGKNDDVIDSGAVIM